MTRLLTAAVAVPLLVLIVMTGPAELFSALVFLIALGAYREVAALTASRPLLLGYGVVGALALSPDPRIPAFEHIGVLSIVVLGATAVMFLPPGPETSRRVEAAALGALYVGAPLAAVHAIRLGAPEPEARLWIVFLLAVTMMGDAGAYYVGSALGKHRLAPALSPKKTVEGLIGGVAASIGTACALEALWMPRLPMAHAAALGLVLSLVGVLGDLFESLLKRAAGVKDTASVFPGHGGVLDRIDSVLFAGPVLFLYVAWFRMV